MGECGFLPFLIYAIAAIGLNILTGYCGQVSLGTGGFMAVGAYAVYKLMTMFPEVSVLIHIVLAGVITAGVGVLFGLPSLRIKGFTLRLRPLLRSSFWCGSLTVCHGSTTIPHRVRFPPRTDIPGRSHHGPATEAWAAYLVCLLCDTVDVIYVT